MSHDSSNGVPEGKSNTETVLPSSPSIVVDDNGLDPSSSTADGASSVNTSGITSHLLSKITPARDKSQNFASKEIQALQASMQSLENKFGSELSDIQAAITIFSDHLLEKLEAQRSYSIYVYSYNHAVGPSTLGPDSITLEH